MGICPPYHITNIFTYSSIKKNMGCTLFVFILRGKIQFQLIDVICPCCFIFGIKATNKLSDKKKGNNNNKLTNI